MSHDKIKAAARERMVRTGEPYAAARRQIIADIRATPVSSCTAACWSWPPSR